MPRERDPLRYNPAPLNALFWRWNQIRPHLDNEEYDQLMDTFLRYIACIPRGIGSYPAQFGSGDYTLKPSAKVRAELLKRVRSKCELCDVYLKDDKFVLHHTDYTDISNYETIKVLCAECHYIIHCLTGLFFIWFRAAVGQVETPSDRIVPSKDGSVATQKGLQWEDM